MPTEGIIPTVAPFTEAFNDPSVESVPPSLTLPKRATRSLKVEKPAVVKSVLQRLRDDLRDRETWMQQMLVRYAKYRGWIEQKHWQFEGASNAHLPITMYSCQRLEDTLYNAVMGQPLVMQATAVQKQDVPKERRVSHLLHDQMVRYANFPQVARDLVHNLVVDGTVHVLIPWIRGTQTIREFARIPPPQPGGALLIYLSDYFREMYGGRAVIERDGHRFHLLTEAGPVDIEVYEGYDGDLEIIESREMRFDHLGVHVSDLEDIVVPSNCTNPQPPTEANPTGAHHVFRLCAPLHLDSVKRRKQQGLYDLLTDKDLEAVGQWTDERHTGETHQLKEQKDAIDGVASQAALGEHQTVHVVEAYDRYDVNGDGFEEDVIFTLITNASYTEGYVVRARYLTEIVPPGDTGVRRPIEKFTLYEETNRYYGIGLPELIEGSQDMMNTLFNFGVDAGVISNTPFFFYRAASGLKQDVLRLNPGEGYPLDDPRADVYFPSLSQANGTFVFNELAMLNQFLEKLTMQNTLSFGGVPQGKSAALRTSGNMQAVLGQGDTRVERILRHLMGGLARVWEQGLALCQRYLPPMTEYRLLGIPDDQEEFDRIQDRSQIAGRFRFRWTSTILNTNPLVKQQSIMGLMQLVSNPVMLQAQLTGPEQLYRAARRYLDVLDEPNPEQFLKRPPGVSSALPHTVETVLSMILVGLDPGPPNPAEPIQEHAQRLVQLMNTPDLMMALSPPQKAMLDTYVRAVAVLLAHQQQQAQLAQAAMMAQQQTGGMAGNGAGPGPPAGPPSPQAVALSPASPVEAGMGPQGNAPQGMPMGGMV